MLWVGSLSKSWDSFLKEFSDFSVSEIIEKFYLFPASLLLTKVVLGKTKQGVEMASRFNTFIDSQLMDRKHVFSWYKTFK